MNQKELRRLDRAIRSASSRYCAGRVIGQWIYDGGARPTKKQEAYLSRIKG